MDVIVVYGSVRTQRRGIRAARYVIRKLEERGHKVTLFDPLELQLPLLDRMYKEYERGQAPPALERMAQAIRGCDAVVVVTGEYNHNVPPALSNLLDHFLEEWFWRPSAIVSYSAGSYGGVRAAGHLRIMLSEMGMNAIPSEFPIPTVENALNEDGVPADAERYDRRFKRFADELEWYAQALKAAREKGTPY